MDTLTSLLDGFGAALSPMNLLWALLGVTLGTFIGVLPGLGPALTIALLLPIGAMPAGGAEIPTFLSYFVERATRAGMVGIVPTNSSPAMTAYNTRIPLIGTNPIAFGVPAGNARPIILDMSTSVVARGKIRLASLTGKPIPLGWAYDEHGLPTEDAHAALKGSLAPIGGPKGAGLSLIIDLLTGVLTGTGLTGNVRNITDISGPSRTGHLMIAFDVGRFIPSELFRTNVDQVIAAIKATPSADGGPVYMPGKIETIGAEQRTRDGIGVSLDILQILRGLGDTYLGKTTI